MKGYRTLAFNVVAAVLGVLISFNWPDVLPPQYAWAGMIIVNLANVALRFVTDTGVGKSS